jgi:hypothetical protein
VTRNLDRLNRGATGSRCAGCGIKGCAAEGYRDDVRYFRTGWKVKNHNRDKQTENTRGTLTIVRLGCSFEISIAGVRDSSDLSNRRWYICNKDRGEKAGRAGLGDFVVMVVIMWGC